MTPLKIICCAILLIFSGCKKSVDDLGLTESKVKWTNANITNYEMVIKITCFCPVERVAPRLVKVLQGKIVTINGQPYDSTVTGPYPTINELFDYIETSLKTNPATKVLIFNPTYGYPEKVFFDFSEQMADEERGYEIQNFTKM
jgi:hypothetical protein